MPDPTVRRPVAPMLAARVGTDKAPVPSEFMDHHARTRPRIVAIVPVGSLERAKSRLGAVLDAEERRDLVLRLAEHTIGAAVASPEIDETLVVTPDDEVRELALRAGARPLRQRSRGLNDGLREARDDAIAGGATAVLILPIDLPRVSSAAISDLVSTALARRPPVVAIVGDRHGRGTNALLLSPPDVIDVHFGGDSHDAHEAAAAAAGASFVELDGPLTVDLDTPDDLLLVESEADVPESIGG
jgi:2-phospho-L-lactate/phosphoenolpyruvate guanylyltransferase